MYGFGPYGRVPYASLAPGYGASSDRVSQVILEALVSRAAAVAAPAVPWKRSRYAADLFPEIQDDLQQNMLARRNYTLAPSFLSAVRASQVLIEALVNVGSKTNVSQVVVEALVSTLALTYTPSYYRQGSQQRLMLAQFNDDLTQPLRRINAPKIVIISTRNTALFIMT